MSFEEARSVAQETIINFPRKILESQQGVKCQFQIITHAFTLFLDPQKKNKHNVKKTPLNALRLTYGESHRVDVRVQVQHYKYPALNNLSF